MRKRKMKEKQLKLWEETQRGIYTTKWTWPKFKANPLSNAKKDNKNLAPLFIGQGSRSRWVQQVQVNSYAETPVGIVRLRDLIKTIDGRIGYVRKINSGRKPKPGQKPVRILTLSHKPQGKEGQFSTSANKVEKIIRRRCGLLKCFMFR